MSVSPLVSLSLEEKVGQVFLAPVFREDPCPFLAETHLGNVILFRYANGLNSFREVERLCTIFREAIKTPPIIAVDQEGGVVRQLTEGFTDTRDGYVIGQELAAVGVTTNLAPVVDVLTNPNSPLRERCYSSDPDEVIKKAREFIKGLQASGIHAVLKHFPGLGNTAADSHRHLPQLESVELRPFFELEADAIMVGHVMAPDLDSQTCASLSPKVVGLLRKRFDKVIIADSLVMNGVLGKVSNFEEAVKRVSEVAIQAFEAGCDLLILARLEWTSFKTTIDQDEELIIRVMEAFKEAVDSGRISEDRLDASVARIFKMKGIN